LQKDMEPFPGYSLRRPLGRGSFGEVWEARTSDGGRTALKFLPVSGVAAQREVRSIQAVRQLRHPHLVRIDRVWCQPGYIVVAMEQADASLLDLLEVYQTEFGTPVNGQDVRQLLEQAAAALDFLNSPRHEISNGKLVAVQHRDVKPGNLLLFGDTVKLSDFGTAALLGSAQEVCSPGGTVEYSPPEVFQGQISSRSDQYALAITYCHLRGGRLPFLDSPRAFERTYVRPEPDLSMLPLGERPAVARALAPLPRERWPSCREFVRTLAACPG
jgi:serine/threonine protein kinase